MSKPTNKKKGEVKSRKYPKPTWRQAASSLLVLTFFALAGYVIIHSQAVGQCLVWPGTHGGLNFQDAYVQFNVPKDFYPAGCFNGLHQPDEKADPEYRQRYWNSFPRYTTLKGWWYGSDIPYEKEPASYVQIYTNDIRSDDQSLSEYKKRLQLDYAYSTMTDTTLAGQPALMLEHRMGPTDKYKKVMYSKAITVIYEGRSIPIIYSVIAPTQAEVDKLRAKYDADFDATLKSVSFK